MPRIYDGHSDPLDFCAECFPSEDQAKAQFGEGEGPDGRGNCFAWDAEHPDYEGEDYRCEACGKVLTGADDYGDDPEVIEPEDQSIGDYEVNGPDRFA